MLTGLARGFANISELIADLEPYSRSYPYHAAKEAEGWMLRLPNRPPMQWRAPKRDRLFYKSRSNLFYEPVATAILDYIIERADVRTFFDVGAGRGYFSFVASARSDRKVATHAFEIRPEFHAKIEEMVRQYGLDSVQAHLSGLSDEYEGEKEIWWSITKMFEQAPRPEDYRDSFFVRLKMRMQGRPNREAPKRAIVVIDSIDHYCATHELKLDVIKIDVDGYEAKVLPGGMETFRRDRPVIFLELHKKKFIRRFGVSRTDIVKPLFDLGYSCIFQSNHHDLQRNQMRQVGIDDPVIGREETDFLVFV